jgi:glutamate synthase (NADPH/NADH) small chain
MASTCPKCHQVLEEDYVCCADVTYTWKCTQCRKLSKGFVIPFGRCESCGGTLEIVDDSVYRDVARLKPIQQALQAEMNAYTFYSMLAAEATDPDVRTLFASLSEMEREHLENLAEKYHAHLEADPGQTPHPKIRQIILEGIEGAPSPEAGSPAEDHLVTLYERAIEMERRARAFFLQQVEALEEGLEREIYRELAAEEDEHIALLESGLAKTKAALGR